MHIGLLAKRSSFLLDLIKIEFSGYIFEKYSSIEVMKIRPAGAKLFHANGWTDRYYVSNSLVS